MGSGAIGEVEPATLRIVGFIGDQNEDFDRALSRLFAPGEFELFRRGVQDGRDPVLATELLKDANVVISANEVWDDEMFGRAPELGLVIRFGTGYDNIDVEAARRHNVIVCNAPGANANAVAELAVGLIIAITRGIVSMHVDLLRGSWVPRSGQEIVASTVGLVGFGAVARGVAAKLASFGGRVVATDPFADAATASALGVELVSLDRLLEESDVVSLHAPATPETTGLVNDEFLGRMKRGAYFVNTARGTLVDTAALIRALDSGQLAGAALDVYEVEPLPAEHPLLSRRDVITLPHAASITPQTTEKVAAATAGSIREFYDGATPRSAVTH